MSRNEARIINLEDQFESQRQILMQLRGRIEVLEANSHPPLEIAPRVEAVLRDRGLIG